MAANNVPRKTSQAASLALELGGLTTSAQRVDEMPEVAGGRIEGHQQQVGQRKILEDHEEAITLHIIRFERRCLARRMRITMFHDCLWNVQAFPAGPARAKAEIGILAIQEEALVEESDFFQHFAPI